MHSFTAIWWIAISTMQTKDNIIKEIDWWSGHNESVKTGRDNNIENNKNNIRKELYECVSKVE